MMSQNKNQNGRVDILGPNMNQFQMFDHPGVNYNDTTSYRGAMTGNWDDTLLSNAFFSVENIRIIQNGIRAGVYRKSNGMYNVGEQDSTNLKIIMRSIFLQFAKNIPDNIQEQVKTLNYYVLDYCVPQIMNEAEAYMKYKNDVSTLAVPEQLPRYTNSKGDKVLELKPWF
jgi:hypothetical protein